MRSLIFASLVVVGCAQKSSAADESGGTTGGGETSSGDTTSGGGMTTMPGTSVGTTAPAETTTDDDPTVGFVLRPDTHTESECDPRAQDCPRGEKCTAWANDGGSSWNANKCVPVTGDGVDGDPCNVEGTGVSGIDDCAVGFMCWDVDPETSMGVCVAFCDPQGTCPTGTICAVQNDGVLPICITSCDPLIQDCPEGQGCNAKDGDNGELICIPDASGSGGLDGDPCEFDNVCDPGLVCIGGSAGCNSTWCCTPWCDLSMPNTCPGAGEECIAHFDDPPPGTEDVGICVVPA
ncbi:MAG TPA: ribulose phosphate epimerase [Nannocystaceae bacterium]|nr:ribulose phosphate epimerase [Nannocystaceae bacterium]